MSLNSPVSLALNPVGKPPRAAYIHVPFCAHRCGYCNFTLVADRTDLVKPYLRAIAQELALLGEARRLWRRGLWRGGGEKLRLLLLFSLLRPPLFRAFTIALFLAQLELRPIMA